MITSPLPRPEGQFERYRAVVVAMLAAALAGAGAGCYVARLLGDKVLDDASVTLLLAAGVLAGILVLHVRRPRDTERSAAGGPPPPDAPVVKSRGVLPAGARGSTVVALMDRARAAMRRGWRSWGALGLAEQIRIGSAATGAIAIVAELMKPATATPPAPTVAALVAGGCLVAAGLAVTAARYAAGLGDAGLPEAPGLARGARMLAWILGIAAASVGLLYAGQPAAVDVIHGLLLALNAALCYGLFTAKPADSTTGAVFPLDLAALEMLGARANVVASILDFGEHTLGIDLRSTWALSVARRSLEPLAFGMLLAWWLSTSVTIVGVQEVGLLERFGAPAGETPLTPGLHVHWPWPIDGVDRLPLLRVQSLGLGHETEEAGGPENVIWSVEHAPGELALLLGNGRDLIAIDATVQYRIRDPRAWRYHVQNPADALRALAYRAVMRNTVNHTLTEVLSENLTLVAARMRQMAQADADSLRLGVDIVGFTIGGMHPPEAVAPAYQGVVTAQIGAVTQVVQAQAYRNRVLPGAQESVLVGADSARAAGAEALGRAAGEAWSFRTLDAQYRVNPAEFMFRRRLEALERSLADYPFTIVDARFIRDGGELWSTP